MSSPSETSGIAGKGAPDENEERRRRQPPRRRQLQAYKLFFPGATILALLAVPLWALQYSGIIAPWPAAAGTWHGHEMVFGYALAVVAGYLITKASAAAIVATFILWLAARAIVIFPGVPAAVDAAVALAFPAALFLLGGVQFLRAAKGIRNAVFGLFLAGFFVAELLYRLGASELLPAGRERGVIFAMDLVVLLLFTMGGRVIAGATSGAIQAKGAYVKRVAQPGLERAGLAALAVMSLLDVLQWEPRAAAVLAFGVAVVVAVRLVRWQAWRVVGVPEVSTLHLGYAWISVGLLIKAAAQGLDAIALFESTHALMVGGLGVLSLAMMARASQQRLRRPIAFPPLVLVAIGLITVAAILRTGGAAPELRISMVEAAAIAWTAAFFLFALFLVRLLSTRPDGQ